jgi:hypothetical protein
MRVSEIHFGIWRTRFQFYAKENIDALSPQDVNFLASIAISIIATPVI